MYEAGGWNARSRHSLQWPDAAPVVMAQHEPSPTRSQSARHIVEEITSAQGFAALTEELIPKLT
jgi:hypothetical protein